MMAAMTSLAPDGAKPPFIAPNPITSALVFVGETWRLAAQAAGEILRGRADARNTVAHMAAIGADAIPIVLLTTLSTGAVLAFYTAGVFVHFGGVTFVGGMLTLSFLLELGPLLAGIMVAARSGASIAAEIGSMVVTEQVDALRSMAVSPVRYLVAPRLLACVAMMPVVGLFAAAGGIAGAFVMSGTQGVTAEAFLESARTYATEWDLVKGLVKTLWFGLTIACVACRQGLRTERGAAGVGRSTTSSVVICIVLIFVSDFFLAQVLSGASVAVR